MSTYGIKNFITTPHVLGNLYPNSSIKIKEKLILVREALLKNNMHDISIHAAAEYMLDEQFFKRLENNDILVLKDTYVLVEMSYFSAPINLFEILFEIQLKGYKPILAHPERYNFYHNNIQKYYKLKQAGCLFQLNLLSLTEQYGKHVQKISRKLLKENLYDFVGTDTHNGNHLDVLQKIGTKNSFEKVASLMKHNIKIFG